MTKEKKVDSNETKNFMESLKANESLKTVLSTALKNTQSLMSVLLPKISLAIKDLIVEFNAKNKGNTKTTDSDLIQVKALREHAFSLVNYNRKQQLNTSTSFMLMTWSYLVRSPLHIDQMSCSHPHFCDDFSRSASFFSSGSVISSMSSTTCSVIRFLWLVMKLSLNLIYSVSTPYILVIGCSRK